VREAEDAGVNAIQIDVMDGRFVPNITFGANVVSALRPITKLFLDVHLMIVEPERHLKAYADAGANRIIFHQETCVHLHRVIDVIRSFDVEAGIALNPATPIETLSEVLEMVDLIQIMTVNPGWGGQKFISSQLDKIRRLSNVLREHGLQVPIAVDGGIDPTTAPTVVHAGATILIAGSSIYNEKMSPFESVAALRQSLDEK